MRKALIARVSGLRTNENLKKEGYFATASAHCMMDSAVSVQFVLLAADDEHAQGVSKKGEVRVPRG